MCSLFVSQMELRKYFSYELQVSPDFKRQGLGRILMEQVKAIGRKYDMDKIVLTVFKGLLRVTSPIYSFPDDFIDNSEAVQFYEHSGYGIPAHLMMNVYLPSSQIRDRSIMS